jgi:heme A synthase
MTNLTSCIGLVAPYYNLIFVIIVVILFIVFLRKPNPKVYTLPWKLLLIAISTYILEEILTVLNDAHIITVSKLVAPFLEMIMISLFIYTLLAQKEYLKTI